MAVLARPDLLVLDEVTTGLDPVSRMELWRLIATTAATGAAVVAATTYLDEAERAGQVELLHDGRQLASGSPAAVTAAMPGTISDQAAPDNPATAWRRAPDGISGILQSAAHGDHEPTLEDAAIVLELLARKAGR